MLKQHLEAVSLGEREDCVFRLQVSVDDATHAVHVVQSQQKLSCDVPHHWQRNASVVILLDERQQVLAEYLEGHDVMLAVQRVVEELVKHLQVVRVIPRGLQLRILVVLPQKLLPLRVFEVGSHVEQYFLFFVGRLGVLFSALLYLQGVELFVAELEGQPDSAEVTPAQFGEQYVLGIYYFSDVSCMVSVHMVITQFLNVVVV